MRIGEKVALTLIRDGKRQTIDMVVGEVQEAASAEAVAKSVPKLEGATFGAIAETSPLYGKVEGVMVMDVTTDSAAWRAGLRKDDVITSVNRKPVTTPDEFLTAATASADSLLLNVRRGEGALFILIR
jgi:serine protease Do/serine protease DegQ